MQNSSPSDRPHHSYILRIQGTPDDQQNRLGYHTRVVHSYAILPDDRLVVCDLQCVRFHTSPRIWGPNMSCRRVGDGTPAGNGMSFRLSLAQALTYSSASPSTELPKVSTLHPVAIKRSRPATSSPPIFGHVRCRGYARYLMERKYVSLTTTYTQGLLLIRTMALWTHSRVICQSLVIIYGVSHQGSY